MAGFLVVKIVGAVLLGGVAPALGLVLIGWWARGRLGLLSIDLAPGHLAKLRAWSGLKSEELAAVLRIPVLGYMRAEATDRVQRKYLERILEYFPVSETWLIYATGVAPDFETPLHRERFIADFGYLFGDYFDRWGGEEDAEVLSELARALVLRKSERSPPKLRPAKSGGGHVINVAFGKGPGRTLAPPQHP